MESSLGRLRALLVVALLVPGSGRAAARDVCLWPVYAYSADGKRVDVQALGPLAFYRSDPSATSLGLRPLFTSHTEHAAQKSTVQFLYPISYFRREPQARRQFVLPLYFHYRHLAADGRPVSATVLFPLLWFGESPTEGPWFFVPFVGGVAKGLLGQDEWVHASLLYNRLRSGDFVVHHVLWPFVTWASDGKGHTALRLWPLYGRAEEKGQWWNGYVLWPFVTYGRREAGKHKDAADYWMLFPLYGQARGREGHNGSANVLGPFFYYAWNHRTGYREWRMPWPLIVGSKGQGQHTFNLWPLFGRRSWKAGSDTFALWPLVHATRVRTRKTRTDDLKIFPLFTRTRRATGGGKSERSFTLLWPLWRSRARREGDTWTRSANSLQFAWFHNSESFDRTFNPLLGLVEHEADSEGRRATRLLWRLLRFERGPRRRLVQLGPLASWSRSGSLTRASFMLGLVQTGTRDGKRGWRIFYVPFGASLSQDSTPTP